jgi:apoptosis-inducing factor 3
MFREVLRKATPFLSASIGVSGSIAVALDEKAATYKFPLNQFPADSTTKVSLPTTPPVDVLVHHYADKVTVSSAKCSHYNYDLQRGIVADKKSPTVICPLHDAAFSCKTGNVVRGPVVDGLKMYPAEISKDEVVIQSVPTPFAQPAARDPSNSHTVVIIGGGAATLSAIESLRMSGYTGRIQVISSDQHLPIDRPALSKKLQEKDEVPVLKAKEWYDEYSVDFVLNSEVKKIEGKSVLYQDKQTGAQISIDFDQLLIASGSSAYLPTIPGAMHLENVYTLRSADDWKSLSDKLKSFGSKQPFKVAMVGSGFIGSEIASAIRKSYPLAEITVVSSTSVPMENIFGKRVGSFIYNLYKENKIIFKQGRVKFLRPRSMAVDEKGPVSAIELDDGDLLQTDLVIFATGSIPNTKFIQSDIKLARDNSIMVGPDMRVIGHQNIFAAGDVARFPSLLTGEDLRVEHWDVAMDQGRVVGRNMAGGNSVYREVPFFWTNIFGKSIRWVGATADSWDKTDPWDQVLIEGDIEQGKFVAYYVKNNKISAIATANNDPVAIAAGELLRKGTMPSLTEFQLGTANAQTILEKSASNIR